MKKIFKKIKNNKTLSILGVLIIGVFSVLIVRFTYSYYAAKYNNAQADIVIESETTDDFKLSMGNPLKIDATPTTLKENGTNIVSSTNASIKLKAGSANNSATYNYYLYFEILNNTFTYSSEQTPEIILTVTGPDGEVTNIEGFTYGTFSGISGFDVTTTNGLFPIATTSIQSNSSTSYTTHDWTFTLTYLNLPIDQSGNIGKSIQVNLYLEKEARSTS